MGESTTDRDLLRDFAERGSELAFASLVGRHVSLVFATALRRLDDPDVAQEVTQSVFIALARKAPWLRGKMALAGWLHKTTLLESRQWWRRQLARRRRERTAVELGTTMKDEDSLLRALSPVLDEGLMRLREPERQALLLHYFEDRSYREIGPLLGVGEDAVRKRVAKALEQLTLFFRRQGYAVPTSVTTAAALRVAVQAAPAGVASLATKTALSAGSAASTAGIGLLLGKFLALTKTQTVVVCLLLAAGPTALEWNARARAGTEQKALRARLIEAQNQLAARQQNLEQTKRLLAGLQAQSTEIRNEITRSSAQLSTLRATGDAGLYRWSENSDYVRVPKALVNQLTISDVPAWPPRPNLRRGRLPEAWARDGELLSATLAEILGITADQTNQLKVSFQEIQQQYRQVAETHTYETNEPPAAARAGQGVTRTIVMNAFPGEGQVLEQKLRTAMESLLGPERTEVVWKQAESTFREQFDEFGQKKRFQTATVSSDGNVSLWKGWRAPGETEFAGSTSLGGKLRLEDVPSVFQPFVTAARKRLDGQE